MTTTSARKNLGDTDPVLRFYRPNTLDLQGLQGQNGDSETVRPDWSPFASAKSAWR
jgi:hypothetical protein